MPFALITHALHLGTLVSPPVPLSGGFTHRMYALTTTQGRYAVKLLNPEIMTRPTAHANFRRAEEIEALLESRGLPILPALTIDGRKMHCVGGQFLYVFDYFDGAPLTDAEITPDHCREIGAALARIHAVAGRDCPDPPPAPDPIDWPGKAAALLADPATRDLGESLEAALPLLIAATEAAEEAASRLSRRETICHNDMDPKNVLWRGGEFRIIDLECLGWGHPLQEMVDLAASWGGQPPEEARFRAFVGGYREAGGTRWDDPAALYDSRRNYLDWLAYCAVRALSEDPAERATGRAQIVPTLAKIASDRESRAHVLRWLSEPERSRP